MDAYTCDIIYSPALNVNRVVVRNSDTTRRYISEWKDACAVHDLLWPLPNPDPNPMTLSHAPEQAVLSIVMRKKVLAGELPEAWPAYGYKEGDKMKYMHGPFLAERMDPLEQNYLRALKLFFFRCLALILLPSLLCFVVCRPRKSHLLKYALLLILPLQIKPRRSICSSLCMPNSSYSRVSAML